MSAAKVMPVNLAIHTCINHHPSVEHLSAMSRVTAPRTLTRPSIYDFLRPTAPTNLKTPASPASSRSCTSPSGILKKKKQVVFADDKGLALTTVRIFDPDPPVCDVDELSPPVKTKTESSMPSKKCRLRLGFPQPCADVPSFLESLTKYMVHLESCSLMYGSLLGKVRVCNISPEKAVHVRITYDSWRSHQDIPCTPTQQKNSSAETELYVFNIPVPSCINAQDRLEFCLTFRPGSGNLFMDSNGGQNYRILVEEVNSSEEASAAEKKPLSPHNFQSPQSLALRYTPALHKPANLNALVSLKSMMKRQENIIPKSNSPPNSNNC